MNSRGGRSPHVHRIGRGAGPGRSGGRGGSGPASDARLAWPGLARRPLALGESVAVNGCCLTVVATAGGRATFDVQAGPETLLRTNLGDLEAGDPVNLERSLRVGDRLGGHFVQGHVDTTAVLRERRPDGEWEFLAFAIDPAWTPLMVPKGSIAVDGVSLTLVDVAADALLGHADPAHPGRHHAGVAPARRPGQHRGRHAGQARRQAAERGRR